MTQRTVDSWLHQWTCVGGACAAPVSAPGNAWERVLDRFVSLTAPALRGCCAIPLTIAVFLVSEAIGAGGLYLSGLYFGVFGAYCLANFARCREAHCIITGLGWAALAIVTLTAAVMGHHWLGPVWNAFLVVFVIGHGFELIWARFQHTHTLRIPPSQLPGGA